MRPVDVFAIVVRTVGLLVCVATFPILFWTLLNVVMGGPAGPGGLIIAIPQMALGLWLLRGAPTIVAIAFPQAGQHDLES